MTAEPASATDLPAGWVAREPTPADVEPLVRLLRRHEKQARGWPGADSEQVAADVTGQGSRSRTHVVITDGDHVPRGWVNAHDRAAGRVLVGVTVDPELDEPSADLVARYCFARAERAGAMIARDRGLESTQLDSGAFADDPRQQRWLREAGYAHVRDWWQMNREVSPADASAAPPLREGVTVRRVRRDDHVGMPQEADLRAVHTVLEASFADHFNSYRETFEEFLDRLRQDPGHRWDHWWLAEVNGEPAGALVASTVTGRVDEEGRVQPDGSYVDYIGVHARARGRGVAKALLWAVVADAAERGRNRVGLEVDADSPTGAQGLYESMGWRTRYVTQSWHHDVVAAAD